MVTNIRRSGPTSGKQYSRGKSAKTHARVSIGCDCRVYGTMATEELGVVDIRHHLPDAWASDDKECDGSEHSVVDGGDGE